ncbi:MAG TPA: tRNA (adenosine(37)-N6)-threonylcarbamoyltransferase complex ATPase subunit type 1 TsaE [Planctomycetaceae bacterium]|nr:tRNA (adenosine(37)-N6)-threonylcarbamoyltransferase complex ATPase subunit type 1 TsaE [Planctomycetaceae bacterium]
MAPSVFRREGDDRQWNSIHLKMDQTPPSVNAPGMARSSVAATCLFVAPDERATARLGELLARVLEPRTVVALIGNLGAGKTRLVRAIAEAAGVDRREINSPTFVLVHEYQGRFPVYHFDTYRLHDESEFISLGAEEYFSGDGVCFVEWADRVAGIIPADHLRIEISTTGDTSREFRLIATGPRSSRMVEKLAIVLAQPAR